LKVSYAKNYHLPHPKAMLSEDNSLIIFRY
jgi:hypothetical protein